MSDADTTPKSVRLEVVREQAGAHPEFCNHFLIQADGAEFHIRFYQVLPPIIMGETQEERLEEANRLEGRIAATCIGHVVFARDRMREFIEVMNAYSLPRFDDPVVIPEVQNGE
ncbi:MAG: hypothetical protein JNG89_03495 [Planctomycetaceae bacterium]|nr:hypothetical protein [Planctomycetaceae bacterium]